MKKLLALLLLTPLVSGEDKSYDELRNTKAMAVNIETGESFYVGGISVWDPVGKASKSITKARLSAISKCDKKLNSQKSLKKEFNSNHSAMLSAKVQGSKCKIFRVNDKIFHRNVDDYFANINEAKKRDKIMAEEMFEEYKEGLCNNRATWVQRVKDESIYRGYRDIRVSCSEQQRLKQQELQQEIILAGLLSRCENFGWESEDNISACVQQEAYRDLQIEKQRYEIKLLEKKFVSAQSQTADDEPLFFMLLNAYAETKNTKNMNQMKMDISALKSKSTYSGSSAEAALESLYRDND